MIKELLYDFPWGNTWTFLTAVGTIAMAWTTHKVLKKNDDQVAEMKRQWEEDNKPYLDVRLNYEHSLSSTASRYLIIENYGKGTATKINLSFEDNFIVGIPIKELQKHLSSISSKTYKVLPGRTVKEIFCDIIEPITGGKSRISTEEFDSKQRTTLINYLKKPIKVSIHYKWNGKTYAETITMNYDY